MQISDEVLYIEQSGTFLLTTVQAPNIHFLPTFVPSKTVQFIPTKVCSPIDDPPPIVDFAPKSSDYVLLRLPQLNSAP